MHPARSTALLAAAALLVGTAGGSVAAGSVDIGATAATPSSLTSCLDGTTYFPGDTASPPGYQTTAGVVTSWSTMAAAGNSAAGLKVARQGPVGTYTITGTAAQPEPLVANR